MFSRSLILGLCATVLAATPALAGPPWISVEYPSNPFDAATRDAIVVVHTYHHKLSMQFAVRASAEGVVNGVRQRIALRVVATSRTGVWAVQGDLPRSGSWVVRADMTDSETNTIATALVALNNGAVVSVRVPSQARNGWVLPIAATQSDVDELLALAQRAPTPLSARR